MFRLRFLLAVLCLAPALPAQTEKPVRIAIAGLVHGHVDGFLLRPAQSRKDIQIVGIFEPNLTLAQTVAKRYNLPDSLFYTNLGRMLDKVNADAVAVFTNTFDHASVVEIAAAHHLPVMMEKPMAVSMEHAKRIQSAADRYGVPVVVDYETSWYNTNRAIFDLFNNRKSAGAIRRMVAMDGHQGPEEIGVGPNFLAFLQDPHQNGAGALFDFGCYGANLMTWLMDNARPISVEATTQQIKPQIYPNVDDEATVILQYPKAQGIIEASWNWPFARKDLEVYGETGYAIATGGNSMRVRLGDQKEETVTPEPQSPDQRDALSYFIAVVRGKRKPAGLSSVANNMIVTEILDAARESARTGKRVMLQ